MTNRLPFLSLAVFVTACCLPCLELRMKDGKSDIMLGLRALVVGWSGIFAGIVAWYANPVWLLGLGLTLWWKPVAGLVAAVIAIAVGATTRSVIGRDLPADEGNVNRMTMVRVLPGFYVWLGSFALLAVTSLLQMFS